MASPEFRPCDRVGGAQFDRAAIGGGGLVVIAGGEIHFGKALVAGRARTVLQQLRQLFRRRRDNEFRVVVQPPSVGLSCQVRRTQHAVQDGRTKRQNNGDRDNRREPGATVVRRRRLDGRFELGVLGRQHAAVDFRPCGIGLRFGQQTALDLLLDLRQLVAIDDNVVIDARGRFVRGPSQERTEQAREDDESQDREDEPQHRHAPLLSDSVSPIRAARRRLSSAESGAVSASRAARR